MVGMCHCKACQKRTGSTYNLGAWFEKSNVTLAGHEKIYRRTGEQGTEIAYHFCPDCGSNVYWEASAMKTAIGVAVGSFADAAFPRPTISFYEKRRHGWVKSPENIPRFKEGANSEKM